MNTATSPRNTGAALRAMRVAAGVSQTQLAQVLGVSSGHLSHVEKGNRNLTADLLHRAASYIADITRGAA